MHQKIYISSFRLAVLLSLLFSFSDSQAQSFSDSIVLDSSFYCAFPESEFLKDSFSATEPIVFTLNQRYQPQYENFPYLRVGNPGHAMYSPLLEYQLAPRSLSTSLIAPYRPYFDLRENIQYYRSAPPFTALEYMSGAKKEESVDVIHSRNFGKNLNFSLHFFRKASNGFYNHLRNRNTYFNASVNYTTKNRKYTLLTHYYFNHKELDENGGFDDFQSIENPETFGSSYLSSASNDVREEGMLLSQTIGFGSTGNDKDGFVRPVFRIGHDLELISGRRKYQDRGDPELDKEFYENIYYDSSLTADTNTYNLISNQANLFLYPGNEIINFFYRNEMVEYQQNHDVDTIYMNHIAGAKFSIYPLKKYRADIDAEYFFGGFQEGDMHFSMDFRKRVQDSSQAISVLTNAYYFLEHPQYKHLNYRSNNFMWRNDFKKSERLGVKAGLSWKGYTVTGDLGRVARRIYYNESSLPAQLDKSIEYLSVGFSKLLNWKSFYLANELRYQNSSDQNVLPLPQFMAHESIYFQNYMFKGVILFRAGFDVFYFTGFNGLSYMPAIGEFHTQNSQIIGNYPYVDLFFTFRLKRALFFVKFEHVNKGLAGNNFFQVPNYPVPPRAFKWGLKWTLFD